MKKLIIGILALAPVLAFAQTSGTTTIPVVTNASSTQVDCIKASLDKRENALIAGHDVFAASIKSALQKRLENLKAAWSETDRKVRIAKRLEVWKTYRTDAQVAHTALRSVRNSAWKAFDSDMKACGVKGHGESPAYISSPNTAL